MEDKFRNEIMGEYVEVPKKWKPCHRCCYGPYRQDMDSGRITCKCSWTYYTLSKEQERKVIEEEIKRTSREDYWKTWDKEG